MIGELERKRLDLYDMKDKFEDQVKRAKELIISISDNKEATEELANLLIQLGGDVERVKSAIVDNKRGIDLLYKVKSLG
jgi:hypothetical protein